MAKVFVPDNNGLAEFRRVDCAPLISGIVSRKAGLANSLGAGTYRSYTRTSSGAGGRIWGYVTANDYKARLNNAKNNTLEKIKFGI